MLLIFMYHRVQNVGRESHALETHLRYLVDHYPIIWPGENIQSGIINVCLTFDDATIDFYTHVFPLLNILNTKAVIAIPTGWINKKIELCTWDNVREMHASGKVYCAAHGHNHVDMSLPITDINEEINLSFIAFNQNLGFAPKTFVYPYGRISRKTHHYLQHHYTYTMRIGGAINHGWHHNNGLLYRVNAENFWPDGKIWNWNHEISWRLKYYINRWRGK